MELAVSQHLPQLARTRARHKLLQILTRCLRRCTTKSRTLGQRMWTTPGTRQQQPHTDYISSPCHFLAHLMHPQYRPEQDRDGSSVSFRCFETLSLLLLLPLALFVCCCFCRSRCSSAGARSALHLEQLYAQLRQAAAFHIARGRVRASATSLPPPLCNLHRRKRPAFMFCDGSERDIFRGAEFVLIVPRPFSSRMQRMAIL